MTQPSNQELLDHIEAVDHNASVIIRDKLSTADFKDRITKLENGIGDKVKDTMEDKSTFEVLITSLGLKDATDGVFDAIKAFFHVDLSGMMDKWSEKNTTAMKIAATAVGAAVIASAVIVLGKAITEKIKAIGEFAGRIQRGGPVGVTLGPADPTPIEKINTLVEEIKVKVAGLGPKFATLSKGIRTSITSTGELKLEVSTLNSGIGGLTSHMTTFSDRMSAMTAQIQHMNRELTGSAPS